MPHTCEFHPNQSDEPCGRPAVNKVRLTVKDTANQDEHWLWVCEGCMSEAVTWWGQGWSHEF